MDLIVSFIIFIGAMLFCLTGGHTMVIALGIGLICFAVTGIRRGFSAGNILGMCRSGLRDAVIVVIVMFIIGFVTGIWRSAGTISFFVYYGMEVITPKLFLVITFLLCCILSYALGTSFGVAGTVGVIFMALARSGGVNEAVTAGVIMSGIYFGDRNSPVSSSAVLVAGVTHTSLYDNVRLMLKTGAPAIALTFIAYCFLSVRNPIIAVDESFKELLTDEFSISPWCALPAALILILPVLKVSVINSLIASIVAGTAVSILVQGESVGNVCLTLLRGYEIDGPLAEIMNGGRTDLHDRGGFHSGHFLHVFRYFFRNRNSYTSSGQSDFPCIRNRPILRHVDNVSYNSGCILQSDHSHHDGKRHNEKNLHRCGKQRK